MVMSLIVVSLCVAVHVFLCTQYSCTVRQGCAKTLTKAGVSVNKDNAPAEAALLVELLSIFCFFLLVCSVAVLLLAGVACVCVQGMRGSVVVAFRQQQRLLCAGGVGAAAGV